MFYVIVPIYKIGKHYFERCLQSLKNNVYSSVMYIFINDCSPTWNEEEQIFLKYKKFFNHVVLNNDNNIGLGPTRNIGLKYIKNNFAINDKDYIFFIDPDDEITKRGFKKIYNSLKYNNFPDILRFMFLFKKNKKPYSNFAFPSFSNKGSKHMLNTFYEMSWLACYKASWIFEQNLYFFNSRYTHEDIYYSLITSSCTDKIASTNKIFYIYSFSREGSLMDVWNNNKGDKEDSLNWINYVSFYLNRAFYFLTSKKNNIISERTRFYFQKYNYTLADTRLKCLAKDEYKEYAKEIENIYIKLDIPYWNIDNQHINKEKIINKKIKFYYLRQIYSIFHQQIFLFFSSLFRKYRA